MGWGLLDFAARRSRPAGCNSDCIATYSLSSGVSLAGIALLIAVIANLGTASAQTSSAGIATAGNAVVTGFSGAPPPQQIAPGEDPGDATFIDPNGPSVQVFDLHALGAPPQAQVIGAPVPLVVTAAQVGQVFGVALDNATPPDIYVAATSVYGLPIVVGGQGGTPKRLHQGAPGAAFMAGLFGPAAQGAGPGSIWRIDGVSGAVTLFANVTLASVINSGPALGGLAFDPASNSLFAADRQTGMIHRFNLSGAEIGRYDHGVQGLAATGQPQVPYAPSSLDITSAKFSSDKPETWGYAPPQRRIFGLAVRAGRLYYAVTQDLQIWSVGIAPDGSFGNDARMEVQVPLAAGPTEVSKIAFDDNGDMILAERAAPTGDYALATLAQPGIGRVLRYAPVPRGWQPAPDRYAIGFPDPNSNDNGGVAVGYGYDANGNLDRASCGGFVWSTGEDLRNSANSNLATVLAANGSLHLNGLQGNGIDLVVPANVPPLQAYFVDYNAQFADPGVHGYLGDIAIPRTCGQSAVPEHRAQLLPPGLSPPGLVPPGYVPPALPPGSSCAASQGLQCCPAHYLPASSGGCTPFCPMGQVDPASFELCKLGFNPVAISPGVYNCLDGSKPNPSTSASPGCIAESPFANPANCPQGSVFEPDPNFNNFSVCRDTPLQKKCAAQGLQVGLNGQSCAQVCPSASGGYAFPVSQCCQNGEVPGNNGQCPSTPPNTSPTPPNTPPTPPNTPPTPTTTTPQSCSGGALYCATNSSGNCPTGTTPYYGGSCLATGATCPTNIQWCCPGSELPDPANAGQCCLPGQIPAGGSGGCMTPGTPPPPTPQLPLSVCLSADNAHCPPLPPSNAMCPPGQSTPAFPACCPTGTNPDGQGGCLLNGGMQLCPGGSQPMCCAGGGVEPNAATGMCCPIYDIVLKGVCTCPGLLDTAGMCCPSGGFDQNGHCLYATTATKPPGGTTCPAGTIRLPDRGCQACASGYTPNADQTKCLSVPWPRCPPGQSQQPNRSCACPSGEVPTTKGCGCPIGTALNAFTNECYRPTTWPHRGEPAGSNCADGYTKLSSHVCCLATQATANGQCCPAGQSPNADGICRPVVPVTNCPSGETLNSRNNICETPSCPAGQTRDAARLCACPSNQQLNADTGRCEARRVEKDHPQTTATCAAGYVLSDGGMCQRITATCSEKSGEVPGPNGTCVCPRGATLDQAGICYCQSSDRPANGHDCGPKPEPCPPGQETSTGACCLPGTAPAPNGSCALICAPGQQLEPNGVCGPIVTPPPSGGCPPGEIPNPAGNGCFLPTRCPPGAAPGTNGCPATPGETPSPPIHRQTCGAGEIPGPNGTCVKAQTPCPAGEERNADGLCRPTNQEKTSCTSGEERNAEGACVKSSEPANCPPGEVRTSRGCESEKTNEPTRPKIETPRIETPKLPPPKLKLPPPPRFNAPVFKLPKKGR